MYLESIFQILIYKQFQIRFWASLKFCNINGLKFMADTVRNTNDLSKIERYHRTLIAT